MVSRLFFHSNIVDDQIVIDLVKKQVELLELD